MKQVVRGVCALIIAFSVSSCGGGGDASFTGGTSNNSNDTNTTDSTTTAPTSSVADLSLATTTASVKSADSDSATVTATVLDSNNAALEGETVTFTADAGKLSAASADTGPDGTAQITFSSGTSNPSNAVATITASAANVDDVILPIRISGSTVTTAASTTALVLGGQDTATLTITATDAGGNGIYNADVSLSVSGSGAATLADTSGTTNVDGQFSTTVTGTATGSVIVSASALGATGTATLNVQAASAALQITTPANDPVSSGVGNNRTVTVSAPNVTTAVFVTSLGTWTECPGKAVCERTVDANEEATATLVSNTAGTATVQVYEKANDTNVDTLHVDVVVQTVAPSSNISLQAAASTIGVSVGDNTLSTELTATLKDPANAPIADAPVYFSLSNTTASGEYVSPAFATTQNDGTATTTFYSGSKATGADGVRVTATVYDTNGTAIASSQDVVVGQLATSVAITGGSQIASSNNDASYTLPMTVAVADAAGNPVSGQTVTLKAWPKIFRTGFWDANCDAGITGEFSNEDIDRDIVKDAGEDMPIIEVGATYTDTAGDDYTFAVNAGPGIDVAKNGGAAADGTVATLDTGIYTVDITGDNVADVIVSSGSLNGDVDTTDIFDDGTLTPANSVAGTLPSQVTTDENGYATFDLVYPKNSAVWVVDEIIATTQVNGTETKGTLTMQLGFLVGEECNLNHSPYNPN